jgi:hypothetical protein
MSIHMPVKVNGPNNAVTQPYYGTVNTAGGMMNTAVANPPAQQVSVQIQNPHQVSASQVPVNANPFKIEAYIQKFTLSVLVIIGLFCKNDFQYFNTAGLGSLSFDSNIHKKFQVST